MAYGCPRCEHCGQDTLAMEVSGRAGRAICQRCLDVERAPQGETVRLFEPAPAQLQGQTDLFGT